MPKAQPAGEAGAEYLARIEAAILAQPGGDVERLMAWAERALIKKARHLFTVEDYQHLLEAVQAAARKKGSGKPQEGPQQAPTSREADPETGEVLRSGAETTGGGGDGELTLWEKEEAEERAAAERGKGRGQHRPIFEQEARYNATRGAGAPAGHGICSSSQIRQGMA